MRHFIFASVLALAPVSSFAGQVTFTVKNSTDTYTRSFDIPDADVARLLATVESVHGIAAPKDAWAAWSAEIMRDLVNRTQRFEREKVVAPSINVK